MHKKGRVESFILEKKGQMGVAELVSIGVGAVLLILLVLALTGVFNPITYFAGVAGGNELDNLVIACNNFYSLPTEILNTKVCGIQDVKVDGKADYLNCQDSRVEGKLDKDALNAFNKIDCRAYEVQKCESLVSKSDAKVNGKLCTEIIGSLPVTCRDAGGEVRSLSGQLLKVCPTGEFVITSDKYQTQLTTEEICCKAAA